MKELEVLGEGANFTAVSAGSFDELGGFELPMGGGATVKGKVFTGAALKSTGMEMSLQTMAPGQESPFVHAHKKHEELYMVIKGEGEFRVDDKVFPIAEGSLVRIAPAGKRSLRNTGKDNLVVMCIQYMADSFGPDDTPAGDGIY
jgi:mannose-6-phosphate isomerase-like protein (cupin superfamily)